MERGREGEREREEGREREGEREREREKGGMHLWARLEAVSVPDLL